MKSPVLAISGVSGKGLSQLLEHIWLALAELKKAETAPAVKAAQDRTAQNRRLRKRRMQTKRKMMATEPRMATVLALDIGNTHVSYAAVWGEQVYTPGKIAIDHLEDLPAKLTELWSAMDKPRRVVAGSAQPRNSRRR